MRSTTVLVLVVALVTTATIAACSGAASTEITNSGPGSDAGGSTSDGAASTVDGGGLVDGGGRTDSGGGVDSGIVVTEKPAPACNDLPQLADAVKAAGMSGNAPAPLPITTIAPGPYVVTTITDYNGSNPIQDTASRTTVFFTATKEYYVRDDDTLGTHQVVTLDWKIDTGKLVRNVLCTSSPIGTTGPITYRIGASANGFTVFVDNQQPGNRTEAVRYERAP